MAVNPPAMETLLEQLQQALERTDNLSKALERPMGGSAESCLALVLDEDCARVLGWKGPFLDFMHDSYGDWLPDWSVVGAPVEPGYWVMDDGRASGGYDSVTGEDWCEASGSWRPAMREDFETFGLSPPPMAR